MVLQSGDSDRDLVVLDVVPEQGATFRVWLKCGDKRYEVAVRAVEHPGGIRALEDTEALHQVLSETGHLGCPKHLAALIWQILKGTPPTFPLLLDNEQGVVAMAPTDSNTTK